MSKEIDNLAGNELSVSNIKTVKNVSCLIAWSLFKDFDKEY